MIPSYRIKRSYFYAFIIAIIEQAFTQFGNLNVLFFSFGEKGTL